MLVAAIPLLGDVVDPSSSHSAPDEMPRQEDTQRQEDEMKDDTATGTNVITINPQEELEHLVECLDGTLLSKLCPP